MTKKITVTYYITSSNINNETNKGKFKDDINYQSNSDGSKKREYNNIDDLISSYAIDLPEINEYPSWEKSDDSSIKYIYTSGEWQYEDRSSFTGIYSFDEGTEETVFKNSYLLDENNEKIYFETEELAKEYIETNKIEYVSLEEEVIDENNSNWYIIIKSIDYINYNIKIYFNCKNAKYTYLINKNFFNKGGSEIKDDPSKEYKSVTIEGELKEILTKDDIDINEGNIVYNERNYSFSSCSIDSGEEYDYTFIIKYRYYDYNNTYTPLYYDYLMNPKVDEKTGETTWVQYGKEIEKEYGNISKNILNFSIDIESITSSGSNILYTPYKYNVLYENSDYNREMIDHKISNTYSIWNNSCYKDSNITRINIYYKKETKEIITYSLSHYIQDSNDEYVLLDKTTGTHNSVDGTSLGNSFLKEDMENVIKNYKNDDGTNKYNSDDYILDLSQTGSVIISSDKTEFDIYWTKKGNYSNKIVYFFPEKIDNTSNISINISKTEDLNGYKTDTNADAVIDNKIAKILSKSYFPIKKKYNVDSSGNKELYTSDNADIFINNNNDHYWKKEKSSDSSIYYNVYYNENENWEIDFTDEYTTNKWGTDKDYKEQYIYIKPIPYKNKTILSYPQTVKSSIIEELDSKENIIEKDLQSGYNWKEYKRVGLDENGRLFTDGVQNKDTNFYTGSISAFNDINNYLGGQITIETEPLIRFFTETEESTTIHVSGHKDVKPISVYSKLIKLNAISNSSNHLDESNSIKISSTSIEDEDNDIQANIIINADNYIESISGGFNQKISYGNNYKISIGNDIEISTENNGYNIIADTFAFNSNSKTNIVADKNTIKLSIKEGKTDKSYINIGNNIQIGSPGEFSITSNNINIDSSGSFSLKSKNQMSMLIKDDYKTGITIQSGTTNAQIVLNTGAQTVTIGDVTNGVMIKGNVGLYVDGWIRAVQGICLNGISSYKSIYAGDTPNAGSYGTVNIRDSLSVGGSSALSGSQLNALIDFVNNYLNRTKTICNNNWASWTPDSILSNARSTASSLANSAASGKLDKGTFNNHHHTFWVPDTYDSLWAHTANDANSYMVNRSFLVSGSWKPSDTSVPS